MNIKHWAELQQYRPRLILKKVPFDHDKAPVHSSAVAVPNLIAVRVTTSSTSPLLSRFGSLELLPVVLYDKMADKKEIWFKQECNNENEHLLCNKLELVIKSTFNCYTNFSNRSRISSNNILLNNKTFIQRMKLFLKSKLT